MLLNCGVGEDSWESLGLQRDQTSQSWRKSTLDIHWKDWWWSWSSNTLANCLNGKDPDAGKDWRQKEKGTTEDEIIGWHHQLDGHELEQAPEIGNGRGSLACCSPWSRKESDMTEQLNWFMECFLCSENNAKYFTCIVSINPHTGFMRHEEILLSPFYRWGDWRVRKVTTEVKEFMVYK